jgi:hypothetical protein
VSAANPNIARAIEFAATLEDNDEDDDENQGI